MPAAEFGAQIAKEDVEMANILKLVGLKKSP
jgi:hypothetical protein